METGECMRIEKVKFPKWCLGEEKILGSRKTLEKM